MKSNIEQDKLSNRDYLYKRLLPIIENVYKKYKYFNIDKYTFEKLAEDFIEKSQNNLSANFNKFTFEFTNNLVAQVNNYVKSILENPKQFSSIMSNFIASEISPAKSYNDAIHNLNRISEFLNIAEFYPSTNLVIEILKINPVIEESLNIIVDVNIDTVKNNQLETIFEDNISIVLIETYCMLHNIKINQDLNDDFYEKIKYSNGKEQQTPDSEYSCDIVRAYLLDISKKKLLSVEEEQELAYKVLQGDKRAKDTLVEHNLKLVVSIARKYLGRGLSLMDLIQEGNMGLIKAVEQYDVTRGYKLSTFATWWIRQSITRAIADKNRNIRIPVHMYEKVIKYKRAYSLLESKLNREPTIEEIATELELSVAKTKKIYQLQVDTISINTKVGDDEDDELEQFIPTSDDNPEDKTVALALKKGVQELLQKSTLKDREILVLNLRFGLDDEIPKKLEEIARVLGVTRERVRQIEKNAIKKLRSSPHIKEFAIYMDRPDEALNTIRSNPNNRLHFSSIYSKYKKSMEESSKPVVTLPNNCKSDSNVHINETNQPSILDSTVIPKEEQASREIEEIRTKEEKIMSRKLKNIYEYFIDYTKEEIDNALSQLTEEEMKVIRLRYGEDLNHPVTSKDFKNSVHDKFYGSIIPKIKSLLRKSKNQDITKKGRKLKTVYEYFSDYTREKVDNVLSQLTKEEMEIITLRYGTDLDHPVKSDNLTQSHTNAIYNRIFPKMKELLNCESAKLPTSEPKNSETSKEPELNSTNDFLVPPLEAEVTDKKTFSDPVIETATKTEVPTIEPDTTSNETKTIDNEDLKNKYIDILELMRTANFDDMLKTLTPKEAVIVCLRLGYIDGKYFTTESIAQFLGIEEEEVIESTKKILLVYRSKINGFIDQAIDTVTTEAKSKTKTKSLNNDGKINI